MSLTLDRPAARTVAAPIGQRWVAADGIPMALRVVAPADREELRSFFNGLSDLSRYQRFFSGLPTIPETLLERFTEVDPTLHVGVIVTAGNRIVADGRLVHSAGAEAEIAAVVSDAWQGRGIGRRVFRTLTAEARRRNWMSIRADYFSENRRIIGLLRDAGFVLSKDEHNAVFGRGQLAL